jgi:hypothetical protein
VGTPLVAQTCTDRGFALRRLSRVVHFAGGGPEYAVPLSWSLAPREMPRILCSRDGLTFLTKLGAGSTVERSVERPLTL